MSDLFHLEPPIPQRLSCNVDHKDFRPDFYRVGVMFNGELRTDVQNYDVAGKVINTTDKQMLSGTVEPFWRYPETRQCRRQREAWERSRK